MTHTLWAGGQLLGHVELGPPEPAGARSGPLRPAPAFAAVWPAFAAVRAAQAGVSRALAATPAGAGPDAIRAAILAAPEEPVFRAAYEAAQALGLELRNAGGALVPGVEVTVGSWAVPVPDDLTPAERAQLAADLREAGVDLVNYVVVAVPRRAPPAGGPGGPARPVV